MIRNLHSKRGVGFYLLLVFLLTACNSDTDHGTQSQFQHTGMIMGTSFSIKVPVLPESVNSEPLKAQINHLLNEINGSMSTYLEDSELSGFNARQSTDWVTVSELLFPVLQESQRVSRLSEGAFDITVGPLVNLWGFGPDPGQLDAPAKELIMDRLNQTGYENLIIRDSPRSIRKLKPALYLDLSALAKGFAVDQVAEFLNKQGVKDYLVEIGGELRLKGKKKNGDLWRIAIEKPDAGERVLQKVLPMSDTAIATSGDYRNFFEVNGVRFSHTIDPRNGFPITHKLASVTILSQTAMEADALATALMVLGPEAGFELAEQQKISAFFIIKSGNGFTEKSTSAFIEQTR